MTTFKMQGSNASGYDNKIAGLYDLGETLGSGHFAVVKIAKHVFTGEKVAVKIVDKTKLDEVSKAHLFQEVRCMKLVQHPHVVRLYEVIDTQTKLYLVLELGDGGDLYDYIMKHEGGLTEDLAKKYFGQIVQAISYCHQLHVVHRDLKPENVVFFEKLGIVKLTDFGFSNKFLPGQKLETSCGSLAYSAPEILLGDSYDAPAVDIWSLGVILYMLVCGQPPFEKANDSETLTMIMDCKYTIPSHVSVACKNLIASMLVRDPEKRSTLKQISSDIWLMQNSMCDASEYQPLVNKESVEDEDHLFIIQKMINGNIAAKEDILQALKSEKYNHIAATYFLLAERRLRQKRIDEIQKNPDVVAAKKTLRFPTLLGVPVTGKCNELLVPERGDVDLPIGVTETKNARRIRKCSIVKEEEDEDDLSDCGTESKSTLSRRGSRSEGRINVNLQNKIFDMKLDSLSNQPTSVNTIDPYLNQPNIIIVNRSNCPVDDILFESKEDTVLSESKQPRSTQINVSFDNIVGKINSSESENAESTSKPKIKLKSKNPILIHRRSKLSQSRTPSCSSSEASDDDSKSRKKKGANITDAPPNRLHMHRRDSHDDSSDSQDQSNFTSTSRNTISQTVYSSTTSEKGSSNNSNQQDCKNNGKTKNTRQKKQEQTNNRTIRCMERKRALEMRLRESQSLDRICESQEYEHRSRNIQRKGHTQVYDLVNDNHKKREKFPMMGNTHTLIEKCNDNVNNNSLMVSHKMTNNLEAFVENETDIIMGIKVTKAIISTGSRYSRAIKKIRQLKKYFPVVNFS